MEMVISVGRIPGGTSSARQEDVLGEVNYLIILITLVAICNAL